VSASWSAKQLYNFIRANRREGLTFPCEVAGMVYELIDVVSFQENAYTETGDALYFISNGMIYFRCQRGYIQCTLKRLKK